VHKDKAIFGEMQWQKQDEAISLSAEIATLDYTTDTNIRKDNFCKMIVAK
jgi:hypothetical protein